MDELIKALAPAFTCGLALQQLIELGDSFISISAYEKYKKVVLKIVSVGAGLGFASAGHLTILGNLGAKVPVPVDACVTALIISGGTEGLNSILKFLGYTKEAKKAVAAQATDAAGMIMLQEMDQR